MPSSLVAEALTNSAAVSSEIASEFAHSETPTWFTALPSDIQTYLVPAITDSAALSSLIANATSAGAGGIITSAPVANTSAIARNGTSATAAASGIIASNSANGTANGTALAGGQTLSSTGMTTTGSSTATKSGSSSGSSSGSTAGAAGASGSAKSSSTSTGGASLPTAIYGMSLAGAVGLVGLFAL